MATSYGWQDPAADRLREHGLVRPDSSRLTIAGAAYLLPDPGGVLGKAYVEILRFPSGESESEIRPDEVCVISPGGLPEPVTEENLRDAQAARNLNIIRVLRHAGLAEDAGRGIDVMVDSMRADLLDPPRFRDLGHAVEVSLRVRSAVTPAERAWVREIEARGPILPADRLILVHAARGERLTNGRVRELLGIDSAAARLALRRLREAGLLIQEGTRGGAAYLLADSIAAPAGLRLTKAQLAEVVEAMARDEPVTNATVRQRTGLDRAQALRVLDDLVEAGRLVRVGERRGTRYELARLSPTGRGSGEP